MNNNAFEIFLPPKQEIKEKEKPIKEEKVNVFEIVNTIMKIINNQQKDYCLYLDNLNNSDLSFIRYILNHDLVYNKFTRKFLDVFSKTSYGLDDKDYIEWFVSFMVKNKIKFPMFMIFYKFGINNQYNKYKDYILKHYDLDEDELKDLETTLKLNCKDVYYATII